MVIRIVEFLEGILKVRYHLFNLLPAPTVLALKDIDGEASVRQDFRKCIGFINLVHAATSLFSVVFL